MTELHRLLAGLAVSSPFPFGLHERRCLRLDLSAPPGFDPAETPRFAAWIDMQVQAAGAGYAAGGYAEDRPLYRMSPLFGAGGPDARTLHLGIDLWLPAGTEVRAMLDGTIHSTADNATFGDYGPTVVLAHEIEGLSFHTLHGHLTRRSLAGLEAGQRVRAGQRIGWLGEPHENVGWPPHLHFQVIRDMDGRRGDYPGVCVPRERSEWLERCPEPNLLLRIAALRE
ncbi:MAG TPA: peptidoglycan DD-metalloendopeptidase family protein [Solimonas sp.]|nr:peptidoglycan DD-metalloendopeptidase family protein [Solimonas sp.]